MFTLHLLVLSQPSLAWYCLKKEQRLSKAAGRAPWHGQRGSVLSSTRLSFPSPSHGGSFHTPRFWQRREWHSGLGHETFHMTMLGQKLLCNFRMGKESKKGGWLRKGGGSKHYITSLHKYKQKKVCVMFQEYLLGLIWSVSVEENLFCRYILPLWMAVF